MDRVWAVCAWPVNTAVQLDAICLVPVQEEWRLNRHNMGTTPNPTPDRYEELLVELTAQRLITRAIIGHLMANSRKPISLVISSFEEALEKTSPDLMPLPDVDSALQAKASLVAQARARALLDNLGALVVPPRTMRAKKSNRAA